MPCSTFKNEVQCYMILIHPCDRLHKCSNSSLHHLFNPPLRTWPLLWQRPPPAVQPTPPTHCPTRSASWGAYGSWQTSTAENVKRGWWRQNWALYIQAVPIFWLMANFGVHQIEQQGVDNFFKLGRGAIYSLLSQCVTCGTQSYRCMLCRRTCFTLRAVNSSVLSSSIFSTYTHIKGL